MQFNDYKTIKFERSERVLTVTLNLPKTMNAVGEALHTELSELFYDLQIDKGSDVIIFCLLYTSPSPRDATLSRMPSSA